jgi:hypothetical protein
MTSLEFEPATGRLEARCLNQLRYSVPRDFWHTLHYKATRYMWLFKIPDSVLEPYMATMFSLKLMLAGTTAIQRERKLTKLRGLSPRANYTDRATAACRRS